MKTFASKPGISSNLEIGLELEIENVLQTEMWNVFQKLVS